MATIMTLADAGQAIEFLGVKLLGVNADNGRRLLFTFAFILVLLVVGWFIPALADRLLRGRRFTRLQFWIRQAVRLAVTLVLFLGVALIWFDNPTSLATTAGLLAAGMSFALQKVITALAGYFLILRGKTFTVGDRISMGGVRGDVIAVDFLKTTLMEMGQPPTYGDAASPTWVQSRQYTGRVVTVTNDKVFNEPVYNYTRDFPYIWEEMSVPITYSADRLRAEQILLDAATRHTLPVSELNEDARHEIEHRYSVALGELEPKVYYRLTDNWLELTVRFLAKDRGVRDVKDAMSRDILQALDAKIGIASATFEIVGMPPLRLQRDSE